jgi:hypothetical protein
MSVIPGAGLLAVVSRDECVKCYGYREGNAYGKEPLRMEGDIDLPGSPATDPATDP